MTGDKTGRTGKTPSVIFVVVNPEEFKGGDNLDILDVCSAAMDLGSWFEDEAAAREDAENPDYEEARVFKLSVEEVKL